ncbi:MAG TPA: GNAT family N-acetyltransferase [Candidatus Limnocylindrales bacterium]|nr:GNAT family N-acetyltransferase [Candidatus Limnocylindrales bacterium]
MKIKITKKGSKKLKAFYKKEWEIADREHYGKPIAWEKWSLKEFTLEAQENDEIVGAVYFTITADVAYIDMLIVTKSHREKGLGKLLVKKAEGVAKKNGAHKIYLQTGKGWDAVSFYESLGYRITGELPNHCFHKDYIELSKFI